MHGHNYAVLVEIDGDLTADSWVLDFTQAKRIVAAICKELDHRFLLPLDNPSLTVTNRNTEYEIVFGDRRYVIPSSDVAALPIDNSTAERLAEWLCGRIAGELAAIAAENISRINVGIEEAPGQTGWFTAELGGRERQP